MPIAEMIVAWYRNHLNSKQCTSISLQNTEMVFVQSDAARQSLRIQLVGEEASMRCACAWRQECAALAAQQAAIWMPSPLHFGVSPPQDGGDTAMTSAAHHPGGFLSLHALLGWVAAVHILKPMCACSA